MGSTKPTSAQLLVWLQQLRVHHYAKNGLVFVPVLTAHAFTLSALSSSFLAFTAFCLCASGAYIINDTADLEADRQHPTKSKRPLAEAKIAPGQALIAAGLVVLCAFLVAAAISPQFLLVLAAYLGITTAYTFWLKRKLLVDVIALSLLYTLRVMGGAVAIEVTLSEWLLAFSLLIFASLALIKRYAELANGLALHVPEPLNRDYKTEDLGVVAAIAAAAGFNAVTVFALYISSDAGLQLYSRPRLLWLICPILMYWIGRALILAHRGLMDDDPIVFALKDPISFLAIGSIIALTLAAI
jgi:4-hydroxybenzoate polyprenyltransferase